MDINAVLFLDIATDTGYASRSAKGAVLSGVHKLPKDKDLGRFLSAYHYWLVDLLGAFDRNEMVVAYEQPFAGNKSAAPKLYALAGHTEFVCRRLGVGRYFPVHNRSIRAHFLGGGMKKRAELKRLTIDECRRRGFKPVDDNEADAIAGLDYACHCCRLPGIGPGGMFSASAQGG